MDDLTILDLREAAQRLKATVYFVRGLIAADEIRFVKIGKKFCITADDLDRWVMANRTLRSEENGDSLGIGCARRLRSVR